jgi:hypothetical protein
MAAARKEGIMRNSAFAAVLAAALAGGAAAAQVASTQAPAPKPTLAQVGLYVYPAKGQSPEQQAKDEAACTQWAETQTGVHLSAGKVNTDSAAQAAGAKTAAATQGAAVAGAAKGAAVGVAIGAIAGDAGEGAAIGAVAGAVGGRRARRAAESQAASQGAAQAQAANTEMVANFKKAAATCLEGRGYTAK